MMSKITITKEEALQYHLGGKIELGLIKDLANEKDLSLAYTPGVATPCLVIEKDPEKAYDYTSKSNTVAVISDGTAILGLGDLGPLASLPVMEGKAVLFKVFGGVDAIPIILDRVRTGGSEGPTDVERFIDVVKCLAPAYGGINLEDIAAPACFEIEDRLDRELDIPVFHDDQWGTAIITLAALYNYLDITKKDIEKIKVVISGAGAAGIRIADMLTYAGAKNIFICDSKGVLRTDRTDLNAFKSKYARETQESSLSDVMHDADVFVGVSAKGVLKKDDVKKMAPKPAIFAMANPEPEIYPEEAFSVRDDIIMATGRSDYPNQINNVLGFPAIFRGALDARAKSITFDMKLAAARALADLAKLPFPKEVSAAYGGQSFELGPDYIVPKPFDPRVRQFVGEKVKEAALRSK